MRFRLSHILLYATLFAVILGGGIVYGLVTDRWTPAVEQAWVPLERLPMTIGDWDGSSIEIDPEQFPLTAADMVLLRRYVHQVNGSVVNLFLTVGRAGPTVSAHQPDSCYPGAGYQFAAPMVKRSISVGTTEQSRTAFPGRLDGLGRPSHSPQEFRVATFSKTERALPLFLRVYWSFSATGEWRVPDNPRLAFAGQRRVYKLYVIRQLLRSDEPLDGDAAESFLQVLTPQMQKVFFVHDAPTGSMSP